MADDMPMDLSVDEIAAIKSGKLMDYIASTSEPAPPNPFLSALQKGKEFLGKGVEMQARHNPLLPPQTGFGISPVDAARAVTAGNNPVKALFMPGSQQDFREQYVKKVSESKPRSFKRDIAGLGVASAADFALDPSNLLPGLAAAKFAETVRVPIRMAKSGLKNPAKFSQTARTSVSQGLKKAYGAEEAKVLAKFMNAGQPAVDVTGVSDDVRRLLQVDTATGTPVNKLAREQLLGAIDDPKTPILGDLVRQVEGGKVPAGLSGEQAQALRKEVSYVTNAKRLFSKDQVDKLESGIYDLNPRILEAMESAVGGPISTQGYKQIRRQEDLLKPFMRGDKMQAGLEKGFIPRGAVRPGGETAEAFNRFADPVVAKAADKFRKMTQRRASATRAMKQAALQTAIGGGLATGGYLLGRLKKD